MALSIPSSVVTGPLRSGGSQWEIETGKVNKQSILGSDFVCNFVVLGFRDDVPRH
jgi:hypothetical protein